MKNQIYELKNKRAGVITQAQAAVDAGDMETYNAKMEEVKEINSEIEAREALDVEAGRFEDDDQAMITLQQKKDNEKAELEAMSKIDEVRSGNEYVRAFANAIRNGYSVKTGKSLADSELAPLFNALTETGGTPKGTDGGFLVPIEFDNMIHEIKRQLVQLRPLFTTENVAGLTGWRALDTVPTVGFTKLTEMGTIPQNDQPAFVKVEYAIEGYGLIVPVSNELAEDNTAGLLQYLARWFGRKSVITENIALKALLDTLTSKTFAANKEIAELKSVLNKELDPDISLNASIITNQTGFDYLDQQVDTMGRPLLQPDPTSGTPMIFKNKSVHMVSDAMLPNRTASGTFAPIYVGDYSQFGTFFARKALEVASTDIGGKAWETNSTEVRGIMRFDTKKMDKDAAVKREIKVA